MPRRSLFQAPQSLYPDKWSTCRNRIFVRNEAEFESSFCFSGCDETIYFFFLTETVSLFLPFARRRERIARPDFVAIRLRKP